MKSIRHFNTFNIVDLCNGNQFVSDLFLVYSNNNAKLTWLLFFLNRDERLNKPTNIRWF